MMDVSECSALEQKLRRKQNLETIGLLTAGIAHDFNNALSVILIYTRLACDALPTGHRASRLLEAVNTETHRAAQLTRQLLTYAGKLRTLTRIWTCPHF